MWALDAGDGGLPRWASSLWLPAFALPLRLRRVWRKPARAVVTALTTAGYADPRRPGDAASLGLANVRWATSAMPPRARQHRQRQPWQQHLGSGAGSQYRLGLSGNKYRHRNGRQQLRTCKLGQFEHGFANAGIGNFGIANTGDNNIGNGLTGTTKSALADSIPATVTSDYSTRVCQYRLSSPGNGNFGKWEPVTSALACSTRTSATPIPECGALFHVHVRRCKRDR